MIKIGEHVIIGWNSLKDPHWGYSYNENYDYQHEFCLYRLFICWEYKRKGLMP